MELSRHFILNDRKYSREELIEYSGEVVRSDYEEDWNKALFRFIRDFLDEKICIRQLTSGTTGPAKSVELSRSAMVRSSMMTLESFGLAHGDSALLWLPVDYIAGKMMVVRALVGGLNLLTHKPSGDPMGSFDGNVDFAAMVPLQLYESLKEPERLTRIKKLLIGGGEISRSMRDELIRISTPEIFETFGMSETYTHFAFRRISGTDPQTCFKVLKGISIELDSRGCLVVDVPGVTVGKVVTNDQARLCGQDEFEWLGRFDNLINSGGIKINPEKLEEKIRKILDIGLEIVVSGIPDQRLGEKVVLVIQSSQDSEDLPLADWFSSLRKTLQKPELPGAVYIIPEFPRNEAMKILRKKIRNIITGINPAVTY